MRGFQDNLRIHSLSERLRWIPIVRGDNAFARIQNRLLLSTIRGVRQVVSSNRGQITSDLSAAKFVSNPYRFVYFAIPKVATSTFRHVLLSEHDSRLGAKIVYTNTAALLSDFPETANYFKFSFVRNPWSRALSCYRNKVRQVYLIGHLSIMSRYSGLRPGMAFDDFVDWLASPEGSDEKADRHWISQHRILAGADGQPACDFVGRQESIQRDFDHVCEVIGLPHTSLPVVHRMGGGGASSSTDYREFYSKRTQQIIADRYAKDIELFGYDF